MNIFTAIMLVFAAVGLFDKLIGNRMGLGKSLDNGLNIMGSMAIPIIGMCCVGTALIQNHVNVILYIMEPLPFDPSMLAGALLAPDMGGWFIAEQLSSDYNLTIFNGIILGVLLGQMLTFQLPIFLSMLDKKYHSQVLRGFMVGTIIIPTGLIVAAFFLKIGFKTFIAELIPILTTCILLAIGLWKKPLQVVKGFSIFANIVQGIILLCFFFSVLGLFVPSLAYASEDSVYEATMILFRSAIVICGALVLSEVVLKYFRRYLQKIANKLGVNEVSVVGMLLNCATSLAMIPLIPDMDEKGRSLNCAFSVSGAFVIGGQMGFVSSVSGGSSVTIMVLSKLICGILSMTIMYKLHDKLK